MQNEPPVSTDAKPHKRRVRYSGKNPRRFEEKYKEHQPERYAGDVQKIIASGKTPAGTHRPICVKEILEVLAPKPGELAADATLGYGGHTEEILKAILPDGKLFAMDADPVELPRTEARLRALGFDEKSLVVRRSNFAGMPQFLASEGVEGVDMVLADLGVSSMQIDNPARGFSYKQNGPLDLRMNPQKGFPASSLLEKITEPELATLLELNADEPRASLIAGSICRAREVTPFHTTQSLTRHLERALKAARCSADHCDDTIRRVFQALRIAVNDEFGALDAFLRNLPHCLKPGGRAAILTFHSGEDRRVKKSFQEGERNGIYSSVARDIIRPSRDEVRSNPRASSAKLRWAIRAS